MMQNAENSVDLVQARRLAAARLDPVPAPETVRQYDRIVRQMRRERKPLAAMTSSQSQFYRARAALTYFAARTIVEILATIHTESRDPTPDERDRVRTARDLLIKSQATSFRETRGQQSQSSGRTSDRGGSRRAVVKQLRRKADLLSDPLFAAAQRRGEHVAAIGVLLACGARGAEIASGVRVTASAEPDGPALRLIVYGVKVNQSRGYSWRSIGFDAPGDWAITSYLRALALDQGGAVTVRANQDALRASLRAAACDVLGEAGRHVTPYVQRHLVAGRIKADGGVATAARVLGHASERSTRRYGGARGSGPVPVSGYVSGRPPKPDPRTNASPDTQVKP
jgi:hypothetical protein